MMSWYVLITWLVENSWLKPYSVCLDLGAVPGWTLNGQYYVIELNIIPMMRDVLCLGLHVWIYSIKQYFLLLLMRKQRILRTEWHENNVHLNIWCYFQPFLPSLVPTNDEVSFINLTSVLFISEMFTTTGLHMAHGLYMTAIYTMKKHCTTVQFQVAWFVS